MWARCPEQSIEYWAGTLSPGRTAELYQRKNKKAMPSDVWKMNWLSFGAGGHLKALKWGDKVDLVQKFQCEDGEAVGFMFVLGALI